MTTEQKSLGQIAYEVHMAVTGNGAWQVAYRHATPLCVDGWARVAAAIVEAYEKRRGATPPTTLHLNVDTSEVKALVTKAIADVRAEFTPVTQYQVGYRVQLDGSIWCATGPGFVDLQASPAAFDATPLSALRTLVDLEATQFSRVKQTVDGPVLRATYDPAELYPARDFRVDTYVPPGMNKGFIPTPANGVRVTHTPSGLVEECHEGRSQHSNRTKAFDRLVQRLNKVGRRAPDANLNFKAR